MATFQLAGLPGMSPQNSNAPDSRVPRPVYFDNDNPGLTVLQGLTGVAQIRAQEQQAQSLQDYQQRMGAAYASNDINAMRQIAAQHPEQIQQIQQNLGFVDANKNQAIGNAALDLQLAAQQGPEAVQAALSKNADALGYIGTSPDAVYASYQQNPQQLGQYADLIAMHALGPEQYLSMRQNDAKLQQTGQLARQNLGYKYDALNQQAKYQNAQIEQGHQRLTQGQQRLGIDAQKMAFDQQGKQDQLTADRQAAVSSYDEQSGNIANMLSTVNQVLGKDPANPDANIKPEVFDRIFGFGGKTNSLIPGSESADAWAKIQQMQAQARQMGVIGMKGTGPVSDAEGQAAAQAFLAINQNMSPGAARAATNNWNRVLQRQANYLRAQKPTIDRYRQQLSGRAEQSATQLQPGHSEGGYMFTGGDPSNPQNWRKN